MSEKNISILFLFFFVTGLFSCGEDKDASTTDPVPVDTGTPVTITSVTTGPLSETIELNATSVFQLKTFIKANATGYLQNGKCTVGQLS